MSHSSPIAVIRSNLTSGITMTMNEEEECKDAKCQVILQENDDNTNERSIRECVAF